MSRSPKYTSAGLRAARERELAERRRQRELERKRREAERASLSGQLATVRARAANIAAEAASAGIGARHTALLGQLATLGELIGSADSGRDLQAARDRLGGLRRESDDIAVESAGILAARERGQSLASLRSSLGAEPDRAALDPSGAADTDRLLDRAEGLLGDAGGFASAQQELATAIRAHLARARARRAELEQMRQDVQAARASIREVLDEAAAADVELAGAAEADRLLARLTAAADSEDVATARKLCTQAKQRGEELEQQFDRWLDQLDRAQLVFEAVTRALPKAGFTILADTYAAQGTSVTVQAERADHSTVQLAVVPDQANGVQIVYHADGTDFVVEQTADGEVARCDLTQEILERFHDELAKEDVETGELHWQGKPATRPDARAARQHWQSSPQSRGAR